MIRQEISHFLRSCLEYWCKTLLFRSLLMCSMTWIMNYYWASEKQTSKILLFRCFSYCNVLYLDPHWSFLSYLPSSGIASCVRTVNTVMYPSGLAQPCYLVVSGPHCSTYQMLFDSKSFNLLFDWVEDVVADLALCATRKGNPKTNKATIKQVSRLLGSILQILFGISNIKIYVIHAKIHGKFQLVE